MRRVIRTHLGVDASHKLKEKAGCGQSQVR